MRSQSLFATLIVAALLGTGCGPFIDLPFAILVAMAEAGSADGSSYDSAYGYEELTGLRDGRIEGELGQVRARDDARVTGTREVYDGSTTDRIVVEAYIGDQWAMVGLDVYGGLNHAAFAQGRPLRFAPGESSPVDGLSVSGLGCSNTGLSSASESIAYDQPATAVTLTAHDDPNENLRHVHAEFDLPDGQQATSDFTIPL